MAQRRMMSLHIIDTDAFMDMPHSAQCLYMHLLMRADDDGFVDSVKKIMRMIGSQDDDIKLLVTKRFVIPFESGVCVIKHWKIHNYIQADRYNETKYIEEKNGLLVKDNGAYTECIQNVSTSETQVRLGKVSKGKSKVSIGKDRYGEFGNVKLTNDEHEKLIEKLSSPVVESLIAELDEYIEMKGRRYKSHYAAIQSWARRKINEHAQRKASKGKGIVGL